jgi:hypothetical protein
LTWGAGSPIYSEPYLQGPEDNIMIKVCENRKSPQKIKSKNDKKGPNSKRPFSGRV